MRKGFLLVIIHLFIARHTGAQESPFVFSHLKESDGLSENITNCLLKDSRGIVWIGTYNGFNMYDGSHFFAYKKRKGPNSMANEVIHSLCEDKNGNIWGSTDNGVFCFNPSDDKFTNYNIRSLGTGKIFYKIVCDKQGNVWTSGEWSLFKFNADLNKFDEVFQLTKNRDSARYLQIRKNGLVIDPNGKGLWLATRSGIFYYDIQKNAVTNFHSQPGDSLFARRSVSALSLSPTGKMWFFNNDQKEFVSFDPASRQVLQRISIRQELPSAEGGTTFEDRNQRLWFSSWTFQLLVIDLANGNKIHALKHQADDRRTIAGDYFWAGLQDDDGTIWLATHSGVSRCNPEKNLYKQYHLPEKISELKATAIHLVEEDPADKSFWIITRSSLLVHYDPNSEKYEVFDLSRAKPGLQGIMPGSSNAIKFFNGQVIITTQTGAWYLKKETQTILPFNFLPVGYEDFKCVEIVTDGDSVIYFSDGKQVLSWNHVANKSNILNYPGNPSLSLSNLRLMLDRQIWMVSPNGHLAFSHPGNKLMAVKIIKDETKEIGALMMLDVDIKGNAWVLNKGIGLYRYYPPTQAVDFWDESDGLPSNRMHKAKPDQAGRVWSMFYNKVSVFIPGSGRFYNFRIPISESNLNYYNHISIRSNGNIFGTINNEIVEFFPDRIEAVPAKKRPQISQLMVNGSNLKLINNDRVVLRPNQNTIRLRFGTLTDKNIFPFDMEYMLEGAEDGWTKSIGNDEALYNNLAPGNYKFRVRAKGNNNAWETEEAVLQIIIRTPFYKTTWFLLAIGLLIIGSLFFLYRYRLAQKERLMALEGKAQRLEKEKVMVMYENLKQQLNPHFLFNSLTSLSGLIEMDQKMAGNFLQQMSDIYRYILKNGDNETVKLRDEIEFVKIYIELQQTRFKKGLLVNIHVPDEYLHYKIAPVTLQNLIENAIKHNIIDPRFPLVIDIFIEGDYLVVRNNLQRKKMVETSNKKGLAQFISLYKYLSELPVVIEDTDKYFQAKIPLT